MWLREKWLHPRFGPTSVCNFAARTRAHDRKSLIPRIRRIGTFPITAFTRHHEESSKSLTAELRH